MNSPGGVDEQTLFERPAAGAGGCVDGKLEDANEGGARVEESRRSSRPGPRQEGP